MSNPSNLVRPPILNTNTPEVSNTNRQISVAELVPLITTIATEILQRRGPEMVQSTINPNADLLNLTDQGINEQHLNDLHDLDKVPDVVKCLREFSGRQGEFSSWKKSVDRILRIYGSQEGTPKYYGILNVIRNKIVGNADIALESYNILLNWKAISRCLALHYADKRDLSTLEYQMTSLIQGNLSVQEFYQAVYTHLSLILNKLNSIEASDESIGLLTDTYRGKALDTFIRGLNGDLPRLLGIREPSDLPQALHLCLKLENQNFRSHYARTNNSAKQQYNGQPKNQQRNYGPPPMPPRANRSPDYNRDSPFYPQLAFIPQNPAPRYQQQMPRFNNPNYVQNPPPRPQAPKPQPKPEPMEIDSTMYSKRVNYINRSQPQQQVGYKRPPPPPSNIGQQPKVQQNFHIDVQPDEYPQEVATDQEEEYNQTLEEYIATIENEDNLEEEPTVDLIHFLN